MSKVLMVIGGGMLAYTLMSYVSSTGHASGRPVLKSGNASQDNSEISITLTCISSLIWGLVVTKANQGAKASQTTSSKSVQSLLKSTG
jgi:hypothetical protein